MSLNNDNVIIRFKRGTEAGWMAEDKGNNPVLAEGEPGYHKTEKKIKIGDGVSKWSELPYIDEESLYAIATLEENMANFQKKAIVAEEDGYTNLYPCSGIARGLLYGDNCTTNSPYAISFGQGTISGAIAINWSSMEVVDQNYSESTYDIKLLGCPQMSANAEAYLPGDQKVTVVNRITNEHASFDCTVLDVSTKSNYIILRTKTLPSYFIDGKNRILYFEIWNAASLHSMAIGDSTLSANSYTFTQGVESAALGYGAVALNNTCNATSYSTTIGKRNNVTEAAFAIGNGTTNSLSNALTVDWSGNLNISGAVSTPGEDYAECFEWEDGNINAEDRIGYIVTLNQDKIKKAQAGDEILGIVSGTACVIGDEALYEWKQKYQTDEFGRVLVDMVEEFVEKTDPEGNVTKVSIGFFPHRRLNPSYDPEQTYIPRSKRPEWDTVGLIGKLHVRDDGTCIAGGYATAGIDGIATYSVEKTNMRVLKRLSDNIILVFMK